MKKVAIVMESESNLPIALKVVDQLKELDVPFEMHVYSAHRTPDQTRDFALNARDNGYAVVIAVAGMAAHLAGTIAANTTLPVIGVPCAPTGLNGGGLLGIDALLSTVQMPTGIPVATVAIGGGSNAAILAAQILAVSDADLEKKLLKLRKDSAKEVHSKDVELSVK